MKIERAVASLDRQLQELRAILEDKLSNWLPAPKGDFFMFLRAYMPGVSLLDQTWQPPAVTRLE